MARDLLPVISWPGLASPVSAAYTCSHGAAPGVAVVFANPQDAAPAMAGDLVLGDGTNSVVLRDCRVVNMVSARSGRGHVWELHIADRRWRLEEAGAIDGCYNQLDPRGRLYPWTIRSPAELAKLCLDMMGEARYLIEGLPAGLSWPGPRFTGPVPNASGVNPPVDWRALPPVQALTHVCQLFGCRLVFDPVGDRFLVTKLGAGAALPAGSVANDAPSLKPPAAPTHIGVSGAPTKFQARFRVQAVGLEWDRSYKPVDLLSYAPPGKPGAKQAWEADAAYTVADTTAVYSIFVGATGDDPAEEGIEFRYAVQVADTEDDIAEALVAQINASADPLLAGKLSATRSGGLITVEGKAEGYKFKVASSVLYGGPGPRPGGVHAGNSFDTVLAREARPAQRPGWRCTTPGDFSDAVATDRLTRLEAIALAKASVFRYYQLVAKDPRDPNEPLTIPGYQGRIVRPQQVILLPTQVDQVVPELRDEEILNRDGEAFLRNFYDGFSRDKPGEVYGTVYKGVFDTVGLSYAGSDQNVVGLTPLSFSVIPEHQVVEFPVPVYGADGPDISYGDLVIQTGCHVRDETSNQLACFRLVVPFPGVPAGLPGRTVPVVESRPDLVALVTAQWDGDAHRLKSFGLLDADAVLRAQHYLAGLAARYQLTEGRVVTYNGIIPIPMSGALQQLAWMIDGEGCRTVAGRHTEFDPYVPPFARRLLPQYLPLPEGQPAQRVRMERALGGGG